MKRDIVIAGVGGQGSILASRLIAQAAIYEDKSVRTAETIGMAQRGGSVLGHVRIYDPDGDIVPLSPLVGIGQADLLLAFEPAEAARSLPLLKFGGCLVSACQPIMPVQAQLAKDPKQVYDINAILEWLQSLAVQPEQPAFAAKPSQPTSPGYQVLLIDAQEICTNLGSGKVLNVVLLGAALAAGVLGVQEASLITALEVLLPAKLLDMNLRALEAGKAVSNQT